MRSAAGRGQRVHHPLAGAHDPLSDPPAETWRRVEVGIRDFRHRALSRSDPDVVSGRPHAPNPFRFRARFVRHSIASRQRPVPHFLPNVKARTAHLSRVHGFADKMDKVNSSGRRTTLFLASWKRVAVYGASCPLSERLVADLFVLEDAVQVAGPPSSTRSFSASPAAPPQAAATVLDHNPRTSPTNLAFDNYALHPRLTPVKVKPRLASASEPGRGLSQFQRAALD
jgi:hypothetical protein